MRRSKSALPALALGTLTLCAWCLSLFFAQRAGELGRGVAVRWTGEGAGVSPVQIRQAERWAKEDGRETFPATTLWREQEGQSVSDPLDGGSASAVVLELYGDGAALWPASFLGGGYPIRGDAQGCAVDEALAFTLWGSADVLGRALVWNGKTYNIRGVFKGGDGLMLAQSGDEDAKPYENMLLDVGSPDESGAFLARGGMDGGAVFDLPLVSWCTQALAGLPALLLGLGLLLRLLRRGWMLRWSPLLLCQYLPLALTGGALTVWSVGLQALPARLIPTKWSDFDFWTRLAGSWGRALRSAFSQSLGRRELAFWTAVLAAALLALTACVFLIPALERAQVRSVRDLLAGSLGAMAGVFVFAAALAPAGGLTPGRGLWLLPTLWLLAEGGLRLHARSLRPESERRKQDEETDTPALEPGEKRQVYP